MDDLAYSLRQLCKRNRDGSHATQADRRQILTLASRQLSEQGFRRMKATSLQEKHVMALLKRWQGESLSAGTLKNRLACLRWWAEKVGRASIVPADNTQLGVPERRFVAEVSKAKTLGDALSRVPDPHVQMSLALQRVFGLRREESLKFQPRYADRVDHLALKAPWAKGGRARVIPITTVEQRIVLDQAHQLAGAGSLIPANKTYIQQRDTYDGQCKAAGLSNMHGLRHHYAQARYEALTGWKAPAAGGPTAHQLDPAQRLQDRIARLTISRELGHERLQVVSIYLGR